MILQNSGWEKSKSSQVSLTFKILAATEEYDQEVDYFEVDGVEDCKCPKLEEPCAKCLELIPIEDYFTSVGYNKILEELLPQQICKDCTVTIHGFMEWNVFYSHLTGDYDDDSRFVITDYKIE